MSWVPRSEAGKDPKLDDLLATAGDADVRLQNVAAGLVGRGGRQLADRLIVEPHICAQDEAGVFQVFRWHDLSLEGDAVAAGQDERGEVGVVVVRVEARRALAGLDADLDESRAAALIALTGRLDRHRRDVI